MYTIFGPNGGLLFGHLVEEYGFVDLGVVDPKLDTISVAKKIGSVLSVDGLSEVQSLSPKIRTASTKNTYSGNYGLDDFPLHTDLAHWHIPPRYFILRCLIPDPMVNTLVIDFKNAVCDIPQSIISRALFKPRRKFNNRQYLLRLVQCDVFRWDPLYLVPENDEAQEVALHLNTLSRNKIQQVKLEKAGQVILIDNWKVLHGRSSILKNSNTRLIERVYLSEIYLCP
jgi:L-asparagine oxygenase